MAGEDDHAVGHLGHLAGGDRQVGAHPPVELPLRVGERAPGLIGLLAALGLIGDLAPGDVGEQVSDVGQGQRFRSRELIA